MNIQKAQQYMKKRVDKKKRFEELKSGDMILVKLQPYRQHFMALRKNQKLSLRYFGPFPIIERVGQVAYKLPLPAIAKIHPVFHASRLKLVRGDYVHPYVPLPITTDESYPVIQPTAILESIMIIKGSQHVRQHLTRWEDMDKSQSTWKDRNTLQKVYLDFSLEEKVVLKEVGIVSNLVRAGTNEAQIEKVGNGHVATNLLQ